ncbi:peptidoglycan recognition protein 1-like [Macrosteles quadrilineatus]|uniref:peptidoglycan recognition protein 1-like n=1 Tax=Macrosteles quadrilineatus TaxID=74068 RepID=UPI0023E2F34F|nr:peptidoglycan recognition protein 1-like [Macrosteles quadrilineatus]
MSKMPDFPPEVLDLLKPTPENWNERKDKNAMVGMIYVDPMKGPYIVYVSRLEWFSLAPRYEENPGDATKLTLPVTNVRVYCTGGPSCYDNTECIERVQKIQEYDMNVRNLPDIAPNFLIGSEGIVYEGRGWTKEATRSNVDFPEFKGNCLDIAYIGDYKNTGKRPRWAIVRALINMILYGIKNEHVHPLFKLFNYNTKYEYLKGVPEISNE